MHNSTVKNRPVGFFGLHAESSRLIGKLKLRRFLHRVSDKNVHIWIRKNPFHHDHALVHTRAVSMVKIIELKLDLFYYHTHCIYQIYSQVIPFYFQIGKKWLLHFIRLKENGEMFAKLYWNERRLCWKIRKITVKTICFTIVFWGLTELPLYIDSNSLKISKVE